MPAVDPVGAFAGGRLTIRGLELELQTLQRLSFLAPLLRQGLVRFKCLVLEFLLRSSSPSRRAIASSTRFISS